MVQGSADMISVFCYLYFMTKYARNKIIPSRVFCPRTSWPKHNTTGSATDQWPSQKWINRGNWLQLTEFARDRILKCRSLCTVAWMSGDGVFYMANCCALLSSFLECAVAVARECGGWLGGGVMMWTRYAWLYLWLETYNVCICILLLIR